MEKETERISKSLAIVERQINELKDSGNKTALDILRKKEARLKEELKGTQMSTNALAKNLLAQRKNIKGLSKIEFNDLIRRLSKRPEYSFLKTMPKDKIKTDLERTAKPVGWRFKGRGNYDKPTAKQIVAGKKSGRVYNERRPLRSDVSQVVKLKNGGNVKDWKNVKIGDSARVLSENKMGLIIKDYGRKFHLKFVDGSEKTYDASELEFYDFEDKYKEGGNIDDYISKNKFLHNPIDEKEVLKVATSKVNGIKDGKSSATLESIKEDLNEHKMSLYQLDIGTLKPARIIGTGYRGNTRKIANTWLLEQIAICQKAIELLEKPTASSVTNSGSTSNELYINTIAEKTATRPLAVKKFVEYHKLTDAQVLNLMQGIGMGTIKGSAFASAIVGDKVSEKAILKFAKSKEAFKTPKTITASALKDASYISNRDIVSLTIKKGSDTITINGNDILDGVYLKNNTTISAPKESASDIVLKIITKAKELDKKVPFWGNLKEKMTIVTAPRVQKLLDAGYDTKEIMIIYLGINSVFDVTIDNEFSYNAISGLFDYEISYIDEAIENYVEIANSNEYELGLKYPELDWSKIIEKYNISKTPKEIPQEKRTRGNEQTRYIYAIYEGDDVVISTTANRERWLDGKKQPKDSYYFRKPITDGNFKDGYWGITSSKKEVIMDILSMIVTQSTNSYVKDIAVFRNNLGGADAETLIENKIKFEQGGNIGKTISFMDWRGDVRTGVITERLKRGYEVMTSDGVALVEDSEIIE
jgi:hypothetical protein